MAEFVTVKEAIKLLQNGDVVAIPTETVYGLAGNALDERAVSKIFKAKNRPSFDPLIVHGHSVSSLKRVAEFNELAIALFEKFAPGPITIVLPKKHVVSDLVTSGHQTVAVRIPNHSLTLELLEKGDLLLAAPSANPFGFTSPTSAEHVNAQLGQRISGILDGGNCTVGVESTIVDLSGENPVVLRLGGLSYEDLEEVLGPIPIQTSSSKPNAPGMLISHYNPGVRIHSCTSAEDALNKAQNAGTKSGLLWLGEEPGLGENVHLLNLSEHKDDAEAARNLFAHLRRFGALNIKEVFVFELPNEGLFRAINDRLKRASAKTNHHD